MELFWEASQFGDRNIFHRQVVVREGGVVGSYFKVWWRFLLCLGSLQKNKNFLSPHITHAPLTILLWDGNTVGLPRPGHNGWLYL